MDAQQLVCRELVELVTDYLDDALPPALRVAVDRHLDDCDGCLNAQDSDCGGTEVGPECGNGLDDDCDGTPDDGCP